MKHIPFLRLIRTPFLQGFLFLVLLVSATPHSLAATKYWIGTEGGSFATAANWSIYSGSGSTTAVPISGDVMVFDSGGNTNATITASMTGSSIEIRAGYTKNITLASSVTLALNTLTIGSSSAKVILGTNGKLTLNGNGTPLTGSGTLDTSTNTPNTVEYMGQGTTNITAAGPVASGYSNLTVDPAGFSRRDSLTMSSGDKIRGSLSESVDGFGYFTTWNGYIIKVRLSDFTAVAAISTGLLWIDKQVILVNGYLYLVSMDSPAQMAKVRLSDFTVIGSPLTFTGYSEGYGLLADPTGTYALVSFNYLNPAVIFRVRLSDLTVVDSITLPAGESNVQEAVSDGTYAYYGTWTTPGKIVKIRFSDFTRVGSLTLQTGENNLGYYVDAIADTTNGFLYFSTKFTSAEKIVKIRISDFSEVATLTLGAADGWSSAISIDTESGFMYVATDRNPMTVIKIRLSDFSRVTTLTMDSEDNSRHDSPIAHLIHNGYLYLSCSQNSPGKIIRISLGSATPTLATAASQTLTINGNLTIGDGTNATTIAGSTYNPITTVGGHTTINANASFTAPSVMHVAGNWTNRGTFTPNGGTVTLNGTNQTLTGSTIFANLTKTVSSADTLTFAATTLQRITGALTLRGIAGALLSIRSSLSGTQWQIDPQGTRDIQYADVQDSNNTNATTISAGVGTKDTGNSVGWIFPTVAAPTETPTIAPPPTGGGGFGSRSPRAAISPILRIIPQPAPTAPAALKPAAAPAAPSSPSPTLSPLLKTLRERLVKRIETASTKHPQRKAAFERALQRFDARLAKRR